MPLSITFTLLLFPWLEGDFTSTRAVQWCSKKLSVCTLTLLRHAVAEYIARTIMVARVHLLVAFQRRIRILTGKVEWFARHIAVAALVAVRQRYS